MNKKVVSNATWIIGCKIIQSILSFVVTMLSARYLGPSNYGLINYGQSISSFVLPVTLLGFNYIIVKELIADPSGEGATLGTAMTLSGITSILGMIGIGVFCLIVDRNDTLTLFICLLYSISLVFQSLNLITYWFQAKLMSRYSSIVSLIAYCIVSVIRILLLYFQKDVHWFALSYSLDLGIIALLLFYLYRIKGGERFSFNLAKAKRILSSGKYYIISGLMIVIFTQTDRIMLKLLLNESETGFYSAAAVCAAIANFVFIAINDSMRPVILEAKKNQSNTYEEHVISLYRFIVWTAIIYALFLVTFSDIIVKTIYGDAFQPSAKILRILALYSVFAYYGGTKDVWILAEEKQKFLLPLNGIGAIFNVVANFILIPHWHGEGAAIASLFTNVFTNIVLMTIIKPLRQSSVLLLKALNPIEYIKSVRTLIGVFCNRNIE